MFPDSATQYFKFIFAFCLFSGCLLILLSCEVQDCGCFSNSEINGRWRGFYVSQDTTIELVFNFLEKNSNVEGSGSLLANISSNSYDQILTCKGSFVSGKLVVTFYEVDSLSYEGYLLQSKDTIAGKLFLKSKPIALGLKKLK
ncbi:MAG: hypothetical protein ACK4SO_03160 [Candidatus Kapaibacteriota bacterium]